MAISIQQIINIAERLARSFGDFYAHQGHRGDQLIQAVLNRLQGAGFGQHVPGRLPPAQVQQIARRSIHQILTQDIVAHEIY